MDDFSERNFPSSRNRRNNKPLMEKRRRARINSCLAELKTLVLQALKKDTTQYSKLEKADILEMTVKHLKMVQRQQMTVAMATNPHVISSYRAGFNECSAEVSSYLDNVHKSRPDLKARMLNHLAGCISQVPQVPVYQGQYLNTGLPVHGLVQQPDFHPAAVQQTGFHPAHVTCSLHPVSMNFTHSVRAKPEHPSTYGCENVRSNGFQSQVLKNESRQSYLDENLLSPIHRVPSPCDSDSGLSDVSTTSFSKNDVSQFDHSKVSNPDDSMFSERLHEVTDYSAPGNRSRFGDAKDIFHVTDESTCSTSSESETEEIVEHSGPMWRPW